MERVAVAVAMFGVFLALYAWLRSRSPEETRRPVQWGWLAAIAGCAAVAVVLGLLGVLSD
jgi:uncharacterized membrane protein YfcA